MRDQKSISEQLAFLPAVFSALTLMNVDFYRFHPISLAVSFVDELFFRIMPIYILGTRLSTFIFTGVVYALYGLYFTQVFSAVHFLVGFVFTLGSVRFTNFELYVFRVLINNYFLNLARV
jgi:hypothetical protein